VSRVSSRGLFLGTAALGVVMFEGGRATAFSRKDAKDCEGQGKSMKEMEEGFFTTEDAGGAEGACRRGMGT